MELEKIFRETRDSYNKAGMEYYNLFHDELEKHEYDQELLQNYVNELPSNSFICDLGCGPAAQYGKFLSRFSQNIYAVDISTKNIDIASKNNPNIKFCCENMIETSYKDSFFDGVISFYAIFHIPKEYDYRLFSEIYRILKPGGKLLLMTHKGEFKKTFKELWNHNDLSLFANFHMEEELVLSAEKENFIIESCYSKKSYYDFPKERIILNAQKPPNCT